MYTLSETLKSSYSSNLIRPYRIVWFCVCLSSAVCLGRLVCHLTSKCSQIHTLGSFDVIHKVLENHCSLQRRIFFQLYTNHSSVSSLTYRPLVSKLAKAFKVYSPFSQHAVSRLLLFCFLGHVTLPLSHYFA